MVSTWQIEIKDAMRRDAGYVKTHVNLNANKVSMFDYANEALKGVTVVQSMCAS